MRQISTIWPAFLFAFTVYADAGPQECYFGPGAANRGPSELVPCLGTGTSTCCLLGDTCLSGNACYNYTTGDLYQYGCTDITYTDASCPYKCGWNTTLSPWVALEYCADVTGVNDTYVCHAPESCGCDWPPSEELLVLAPRGCKEMGDDARVALYAGTALPPYVSLPNTVGGSTGYYSFVTTNGSTTWISTAVANYTPATVTQLSTYEVPTSIVLVNAGASPSPSTVAAPKSASATAGASASGTATASSTSSATTSSNTGTPSASSSDSSSTLSAGAKAGIGVGVAGGVCLLAAVAFAAYLWGRRQKAEKANEAQQAQNQQGPQSPPMHQGSPFFPGSPEQKPYGWQPTYPAGPYQQSPYYDPNQGYMHDVHAHYAGVPSPPLEVMAQKTGMLSPQVAPMELSAESRPLEMESDSAAMPSTPTPAYAEVMRPQER